jgi:hypothetical protein
VMKKLLVISCWLLVVNLLGCAGFDLAGPRNVYEAFPLRNQDPRWGIIVNEGTAHLNIFIYDRAGRLLERVYLAGANRFFTVNGQVVPKYWVRQLEYGWYRVVVFPFYYQTDILGPSFGQPGRYRIDLPKQEYSIYVDHNPTDYYDYGYYGIGGTYRHWGWILRLNGGNIPDTIGGPGIPGVKINFQGNFR